jgi:uncharacterized membrane protein (DUF106 family)
LFGGASRPFVPPAPIVITFSEAIASQASELVFSGAAAFTFLLVVVVASVLVAGVIITVLMKLGDKFTVKVAASDKYQSHVAALGKKKRSKQNARHIRNRLHRTAVPIIWIR